MFLISMVARVMSPGCKADYMPILEGPQGLGKSECCTILGGEWFSNNLPEKLASKEASQHLLGKWLIEVDELHGLSKTDPTALKAFITRKDEKYRRPWGLTEVSEPRQCVFIGTTNATAYLRDETGARRFWPVKVGVDGPVQPHRLRQVRDQLFAEAVMCFKSGASWWPSREFEREHMLTHQEARFEVDAWEESIAAHLNSGVFVSRVTVLSVAREALGIETARLGTAEQRRIAAILQRLGWARTKRGSNGERYWSKGGVA
jgi:predicted P-loop ATPase